MLNNKFFEKLKQDHDEKEKQRKQIIGESNIVLHDSKRVIFSLHRGDEKKAKESLQEIEEILIRIEAEFGFKRLNQEGSYRACAEEYVEAKMLYLIVNDKKIDKFSDVKMNYDSYLGGLCDVTGELVRRAVNKAAIGEYSEVKKSKELIEEIMAQLVEFDMTGYLRTKYDQARGNLRKIEQITYEVREK